MEAASQAAARVGRTVAAMVAATTAREEQAAWAARVGRTVAATVAAAVTAAVTEVWAGWAASEAAVGY